MYFYGTSSLPLGLPIGNNRETGPLWAGGRLLARRYVIIHTIQYKCNNDSEILPGSEIQQNFPARPGEILDTVNIRCYDNFIFIERGKES